MQAEESALMAVDMAAAERRIHSALQTHVSQLRQQLESEQQQQVVTDIKCQMEEEKAQQLVHARQQMQQEVAQAVAQEAVQESALQKAAQLASAAQQESARAEQAAGTVTPALFCNVGVDALCFVAQHLLGLLLPFLQCCLNWKFLLSMFLNQQLRCRSPYQAENNLWLGFRLFCIQQL